MVPKGTWLVPSVRWPFPFSSGLVDPLLTGFPVEEYRTEADSKYAESTDYHFHYHSGEERANSIYTKRPRLATGPVDLPPVDPLFGSTLFAHGLYWAKQPLPGSAASREK